MRVRTITSERSDGPQDVPILGFADEPDIARLIAAHTVFGAPTDSSSMSSVSRHPPAPEGELAVALDCHIGETDFSRYFTLVGNESVVDEMIRQRVLVLMPATPDVPGSTVEGLPLVLDDEDVANLQSLNGEGAGGAA
jgi:hypothetical protein